MKRLFFIAVITASLITHAQVSAVSLQASGLTCSMCSNAIYKSLKTLDFVLEVSAELKTYTFGISFKPGSAVDFDLIKNKVENAGFSVCAFVATIYFDHVRLSKNQPVVVQNKILFFLNTDEQILDGEKQIRVLDKGFVSAKQFKKNNSLATLLHTYHVSL